VLPPQALPEVLQDRLSALHVPSVHVPPQQSAPVWHSAPSETQASAPHKPSLQLSSQQSVAAPHGTPAEPQASDTPAQVLVAGLHKPEQQSPLPVHNSPNLEQSTGVTVTGPEPAFAPPPTLASGPSTKMKPAPALPPTLPMEEPVPPVPPLLTDPGSRGELPQP
jgi:hypothetical protein